MILNGVRNFHAVVSNGTEKIKIRHPIIGSLPKPSNKCGYTIEEIETIIGKENINQFHMFMKRQTVGISPKTNKSLYYPQDLFVFIHKKK